MGEEIYWEKKGEGTKTFSQKKIGEGLFLQKSMKIQDLIFQKIHFYKVKKQSMLGQVTLVRSLAYNIYNK